MAVDMFLKIGDIKGESNTDPTKHKDEIDIMSFSWGQASALNQDTGARSGKVQMQDFHFVMAHNSASPALLLTCAKGEHLVEALLSVRLSAGLAKIEYLKIKFVDVMVSSYQAGGALSDAKTMDQFSIWFGKIEMTTTPFDGKNAGQPVTVKWDRIKGESY